MTSRQPIHPTDYPGGPYDSVLIVKQDGPSNTEEMRDLRVKSLVAEVRQIEARRRTEQLRVDVEQVAARLDALEHPTVADQSEDAPDRTLLVSSESNRTVTAEDADWIISDWRDDGWRS